MSQFVGNISNSELSQVNTKRNSTVKIETAQTNMGKKTIWILFGTSVLFSIASVCISLIRSEPLTWDGMSALVGVLSLLVTLLLGWQIYNAVETNKKIEEIKRFAEEEAEKEAIINKHYIKSFILTSSAIESYKTHFVTIAIDEFIEALDEGIKSKDIEILESPLYYLNEIYRNNPEGYVILEKRLNYIKILSSVPAPYIKTSNDLIGFISKSKETDYPDDGLNWKPKN